MPGDGSGIGISGGLPAHTVLTSTWLLVRLVSAFCKPVGLAWQLASVCTVRVVHVGPGTRAHGRSGMVLQGVAHTLHRRYSFLYKLSSLTGGYPYTPSPACSSSELQRASPAESSGQAAVMPWRVGGQAACCGVCMWCCLIGSERAEAAMGQSGSVVRVPVCLGC